MNLYGPDLLFSTISILFAFFPDNINSGFAIVTFLTRSSLSVYRFMTCWVFFFFS